MTTLETAQDTEVWFRNPRLFVRECLELRVENIAWDRGYLQKWRIDPARFMNLHYGVSAPWRCLLIGEQGTSDISSAGSTEAHPEAVYPTWEYGDPLDNLIYMLENPAGDDPDRYWSPGDPVELQPAVGQEHRVVVTRLPSASLGVSKKFIRELVSIQQDYPHATMHIHGLYSYAVMFGLDFLSVDIDPRTPAAQGRVYMPHGKEMTAERAAEQPRWVNLLGYRPADLKIPRNRCMFIMESAAWAARNYKKNLRVRTKHLEFVDPEAVLSDPVEDGRIMFRSARPADTDRWLCDTCSLQHSCKFFREGAVCAVPDSEPAELAQFFHTRDSDSIIDGLGTLLAAQSRRLNRALASEAELDPDGEEKPLDPEVTRIINTLFDRGVKLAKLVNPALAAAGAPRFNVRLQQNNATITAGSPAQLMAAIVEEFARKGIPRDQIKPEDIEAVLSGGATPAQAALTATGIVTGADDDEGVIDVAAVG